MREVKKIVAESESRRNPQIRAAGSIPPRHRCFLSAASAGAARGSAGRSAGRSLRERQDHRHRRPCRAASRAYGRKGCPQAAENKIRTAAGSQDGICSTTRAASAPPAAYCGTERISACVCATELPATEPAAGKSFCARIGFSDQGEAGSSGKRQPA